MTDYKYWIYDVRDNVAVATINRPEKLNALDHDTIREFSTILDRISADGARALIITGSGRAFSAGGDLLLNIDRDDIGIYLETIWNPMLEKLADLPMPVITALNGLAVGAGCGIALSGDLVIMERSAYLGLAFSKLGLVPDAGATWFLCQSVGRQRATEIMMLGERISADQCLQWGLVYRIVEDGQSLASARELALRLAAGPTTGYALLRKSIRVSCSGTLTEALHEERINQRLAGRTADFAEAVAAFREKRPPNYRGV